MVLSQDSASESNSIPVSSIIRFPIPPSSVTTNCGPSKISSLSVTHLPSSLSVSESNAASVLQSPLSLSAVSPVFAKTRPKRKSAVFQYHMVSDEEGPMNKRFRHQSYLSKDRTIYISNVNGSVKKANFVPYLRTSHTSPIKSPQISTTPIVSTRSPDQRPNLNHSTSTFNEKSNHTSGQCNNVFVDLSDDNNTLSLSSPEDTLPLRIVTDSEADLRPKSPSLHISSSESLQLGDPVTSSLTSATVLTPSMSSAEWPRIFVPVTRMSVPSTQANSLKITSTILSSYSSAESSPGTMSRCLNDAVTSRNGTIHTNRINELAGSSILDRTDQMSESGLTCQRLSVSSDASTSFHAPINLPPIVSVTMPPVTYSVSCSTTATTASTATLPSFIFHDRPRMSADSRLPTCQSIYNPPRTAVNTSILSSFLSAQVTNDSRNTVRLHADRFTSINVPLHPLTSPETPLFIQNDCNVEQTTVKKTPNLILHSPSENLRNIFTSLRVLVNSNAKQNTSMPTAPEQDTSNAPNVFSSLQHQPAIKSSFPNLTTALTTRRNVSMEQISASENTSENSDSRSLIPYLPSSSLNKNKSLSLLTLPLGISSSTAVETLQPLTVPVVEESELRTDINKNASDGIQNSLPCVKSEPSVSNPYLDEKQLETKKRLTASCSEINQGK